MNPHHRKNRVILESPCMAVLAAAIGMVLQLEAGAAVSEPTLILANGNESLLWHSVLPGTSVARWDKPLTATSATLTIAGACRHLHVAPEPGSWKLERL